MLEKPIRKFPFFRLCMILPLLLIFLPARDPLKISLVGSRLAPIFCPRFGHFPLPTSHSPPPAIHTGGVSLNQLATLH